MTTIDDHISAAKERLSALEKEKREKDRVEIRKIPRLSPFQHASLHDLANELEVAFANTNRATSFRKLVDLGLAVELHASYRDYRYRITPKGWRVLEVLQVLGTPRKGSR